MNPVDVVAAVGRVIGDGVTLAAEMLCPRDHTAEDRLRSWESAAEAVEDEICDEADACEECDCFACALGYPESCTGDAYFGEFPDSSAAVSAAADPSPAIANTSPRVVGGEGSGGASDILQSAPPERSKLKPADYTAMSSEFAHSAFGFPQIVDTGLQWVADDGSVWVYGLTGMHAWEMSHYPRAESDPGAVSTPAPGEQVAEDDLAAHIMGDFVSGQEVDPLTATLIDAISSLIARGLLTDFNITRR